MKTILLFTLIFRVTLGFSQLAPYPDMSYNAVLCEDELFNTQTICLNERIIEESNISGLIANQYSDDFCKYAENNIPAYLDIEYGSIPFGAPQCEGVCCGYGADILDNTQNRMAYYTIDLVCINNPLNVSITKVSDNCWHVTYLNTGTYLFNLEITVRNGREIAGYNCANISYYNGCGDNRTWKQFSVQVGNQFECNDYLEDECNLIQNGGFEEMINCPTTIPGMNDNNLRDFNFEYLSDWEEITNFQEPFFFSTCGDYFGVDLTAYGQYNEYPPQPLPSGDNYIKYISNVWQMGQFLNLCRDQKYELSFFGIKRRNFNSSPSLTLGGLNTNSFPTTSTISNLTTVNVSTLSLAWNLYSTTFVPGLAYNAISVSCNQIMIDNLSLIPIDTLTYTAQIISNSCDSAALTLNIPGCYGPYDVSIIVNNHSLLYTNISDGAIIHVPLGNGNTIEIGTITNSLGCTTLLNVVDTISILNPGNADFIASDFCFGDQNTITFLGDQGDFSLIGNTSGATIHPTTGIISNAAANTSYIIEHTYCLDTEYDTVFVTNHDASFTSSDICFGEINTVVITGETGGVFTILLPNNGATVNPNSGILSNVTANSTYSLQYVVGSVCQDTAVQLVQVHSVDNASFITSNFCFNETNVVTITGTQGGTFSFSPQPTDGATLNPVLGTIANPTVGQFYTIQYVTNGICKDSSTQTVMMHPDHDASFTSSDICIGGVNTVVITGNIGGVFEILPPNNGASVNPNSGILSNVTVNSSYSLQYVVGSVCQDTVIQIVQVHPIDDPSFTTSNFCFNETNVVTITGTLGGTFSFLPPPTDGATIDPVLGTIATPTASQSYMIQYVTNGICKDSSTQTVMVLPLPTAVLSGIAGDLCVNDSLPLFIALSGLSPWSITCSNGTSTFVLTSASNLITHYVQEIGTYSIVSVSDAQCSNIGDTIHFIDMTGDSILAFSNAVNGCKPTEVEFWSNLEGNDLDCLWNFGDGTILSGCDTVSHIYTQSGIYSVQFSVSSPRCMADTLLYQYIEIFEDPVASFSIDPENPSIINNTVNTVNNSMDNNEDVWYLNQSIVSLEEEPRITFPSVIQQNELCLVVESIHHCFDTSCVQIFVSDASVIYLPNTFIPDNDGLNDIFKPEGSNLRFYQLQIFDRWGEIIFESTDLNTGWDGTMNGQDAPIGTYVYKLLYRYNDMQENNVVHGHVNLIR